MKARLVKIIFALTALLLTVMLTSCDIPAELAGFLGVEDGADGKSAYEIAVENGFEGTVEEWLESLKGEKGNTGKTGKQGETGEPGKDGLNAPGSLDPQLNSSFVIVTEYFEASSGEDVSDAIQAIIDANPHRTIYFPDGEYLLSKPILTPADPNKSVSLLLSNYAVIKAMGSTADWSHGEAMIRLGGKDPYNSITINGSNYYLEGGIIDGSDIASGISIDSGRETRISNVSIKNTTIGINIKDGANNHSSDADINNVNIVGSGYRNTIGVLVTGYDNTLSNMRIASVQTGVKLVGGGNFLRDIHPLYIYDRGTSYSGSVGFLDTSGGNWYDRCYSDQFETGFKITGNGSGIYNNCFAMWYAKGDKEVGFEFTQSFKGMIRSSKVSFRSDGIPENNAYIKVGNPNGSTGIVENPIFNPTYAPDTTYEQFLSGKVIS